MSKPPLFHEQFLDTEITDFVNSILNSFGLVLPDTGINNESLRLKLNDKEIENIKDIRNSNGRYYFKRNDIWERCYIPYAGYPGCYLFFNLNSHAVYVGKSESSISERISHHIGSKENGIFPNLSFPEAEYVIAVPFVESPYLAPAFESYLLGKYSFQYNRSGQHISSI